MRKIKGSTTIALATLAALIIGVVVGYALARGKYKAMMLQKDLQIGQQSSQIKTLQDKQNQMKKLPDGVMMKSGKMMQVKNGQAMTMDSTMTMSDGTKVDTQGNVTMPDGSTLLMKDGQELTMEGKMIDASMQK